jgi:hypothetical protein
VFNEKQKKKPGRTVDAKVRKRKLSNRKKKGKKGKKTQGRGALWRTLPPTP